jgi:hypothetical protein
MLDLSYKEDKKINQKEHEENEIKESGENQSDELDLSGNTLLQHFSENKKQTKFSFLRFAKQN